MSLLKGISSGFLSVVLLSTTVFLLQLLYLHLTGSPATDEYEHVGAARLLLEGYLPYSEFMYHQFPGTLALVAILWKAFGDIYPIRAIYLLFNCLAVIPLYFIIKKITLKESYSVLGVLLYFSYGEMIHHDFRLIAIRQLSNSLLIWFFYFAIVAKPNTSSLIALSATAIMNCLVFPPSCLAILSISVALIYTETARERRLSAFQRLSIAGIATTVTVAILIRYIPEIIESTLFFAENYEANSRLERIKWLFSTDNKDLFLYILGISGLIVGTIFSRQYRYIYLSLFALPIAPLIPSTVFYNHYMIVSAPAMAIGAAGLFNCLDNFSDIKLSLGRSRIKHLALTICVAAIFIQLYSNLPDAYSEWLNNKGEGYRDIIENLTTAPEPVLNFYEGIYLVEAKKQPVYFYEQVNMRALAGAQEPDFYYQLADMACSILLTSRDYSDIPEEVSINWIEKYETTYLTNDARLLITHNPGC